MKKIVKRIVFLITFVFLSGVIMAQNYIYEATTTSQHHRIQLRNTVTGELVDGLTWSGRDGSNWDYSTAGDKYALMDVLGRDLIPQDTLKSRLRLDKATSAEYIAPTIISQTTNTCSKTITINSCPAGQQSVWYHFDEFSYYGPRYSGRLYNSPPEVLKIGGTSFTLESNKHRDLSRYFVSCENSTGTERSLLTEFSYSVLREWDFASGRIFINSCTVEEHTLDTRSSGSPSTIITQLSLFKDMHTLLPTNKVTPTAPTMYYGRSYDPATGCFGVIDSVFINYISSPTVTPEVSVCSGSSTILMANCISGIPKWYINSGLTSELSSTTVSPVSNVTYYAACVSTTCKSAGVSTRISVTPGDFTLTAGSFNKTNTQNIYKTDGCISIMGLVANRSYRIGYSFNGVAQAQVTYTSSGSGQLNITGFTPGSYSAFNLLDPSSGCSSGVISSTQVID